MRKLFAIFGLAAALWSTDAGCADFSLEWMLVRGDVRDRLAATLRAEDRLDELAFLEAAWDGDADGAEAAARVLVDRTHDPAATPVGSWSLPLADARFFRAVFKWHD